MKLAEFLYRKRLVFIYLVLFYIVLFTSYLFYSELSPPPKKLAGEELIMERLKSYLVPYDPSSPTNYTEAIGMQNSRNWKQLMSKSVLKRLNYKRNGFFIECGALDGVYISNSLLLEKEYGWNGLLIEPDPLPLSILKGRNRKAWIAGVCLSPKPYPIQVEMTASKKHEGLAHLPNIVIEVARGGPVPDGFGRKFKVECYPFEMLLDAINRTNIDYFSLDVEGVEYEILTSIPFNKFRIKLISVEVRRMNRMRIETFMKTVGYKKVGFIKSPSDFIHDELYELQRAED